MKNRDNSSHSTESLKEHSGEICVRQSKVPDTSLHLLLGHPWNHSEQGMILLNYSLYLDGLQDSLLSLSLQVYVCKTQSWGAGRRGARAQLVVDGGQPCCQGLGWCRQRRWYSLTFIQDYGLANFYINHKKNKKTKQTIIRPCPGIHEGSYRNKGLQTDPFCQSWLLSAQHMVQRPQE